MATMPSERLMRKRRRDRAPVTSRSMALFRLGEMCNNKCPMCSNTGRPEAFFISEEALLQRVARLAVWGFRRVVLTGGEPTLHPSFFTIAETLQAREITFDLNTHGRTFVDTAFAERCVGLGLERAIVSLHSHETEASRAMSGFSAQAHDDTLAGVRNLRSAGVGVMLNLVLSTWNLGHLAAFVRFSATEFGTDTLLKICFPYTGGKGGDWPAIQLRYDDIRQPLREAQQVAQTLGVRLLTESIPNCVHGDPSSRDGSRSGFGETHYLDDVSGEQIYPIRFIESELKVWPERCQSCAALAHCPGVQEAYALRYGVDELRPFGGSDTATSVTAET